MLEITFEYWNKLASQTVTISSLLGGFTIAIIANMLVSELNTKLSKTIMVSSTIAACLFLITVFAMTSVILKTTDGYPIQITETDFRSERLLGTLTFFLGVVSLLVIIALAGWSKSRKLGMFTTVASIATLISIFILIS